MEQKNTMTTDRIKKKFRDEGITVTSWAEKNGFRRHAVYQVLNGFTKASYGNSHDIAVALGLKPNPQNAA